jgi:hypothetical protein
VAARGSGGRQPSATHGDHFTLLRVSHVPGPRHSRFASRTNSGLQSFIPFLSFMLDYLAPLSCSVRTSVRKFLVRPRRLPCQWRAVSDFGLHISQWKCARIFVLAIAINSIWWPRSIQPNAHSSSASSVQADPYIHFARATFERALKKTPVSPLKLPRKYSG